MSRVSLQSLMNVRLDVILVSVQSSSPHQHEQYLSWLFFQMCMSHFGIISETDSQYEAQVILKNAHLCS